MAIPEPSDYTDDGPVRRFSRAAVTGLLVKAMPNDDGHIPAVIEVIEERKRRRFWL